MTQSILHSIKKNLGLAPDYEAFDSDIMIYINSVLSTLTQLGAIPEPGFMIQDESATWADLLGDDPRLNVVQSYVTLRVRMLFDPPQTGYLVTAMESQIKEMEWRLTVTSDELDTEIEVDGGSVSDPESSFVYDGGTP